MPITFSLVKLVPKLFVLLAPVTLNPPLIELIQKTGQKHQCQPEKTLAFTLTAYFIQPPMKCNAKSHH